MAKVTVNHDNESGDFSVYVNGELINDVKYITFERYDSITVCSIESSSQSEDGLIKYTRLVAKESDEGKNALNKGANLSLKFKDFVELGGNDKIKKDIEKYFCRD